MAIRKSATKLYRYIRSISLSERRETSALVMKVGKFSKHRSSIVSSSNHLSTRCRKLPSPSPSRVILQSRASMPTLNPYSNVRLQSKSERLTLTTRTWLRVWATWPGCTKHRSCGWLYDMMPGNVGVRDAVVFAFQF